MSLKQAHEIYRRLSSSFGMDNIKTSEDSDRWQDLFTDGMASIGWTTDQFWKEYIGSEVWFVDSTKEYIETHCTTEMSISAENLDKVKPYLATSNEKLRPEGARWVAWICKICAGHTEGRNHIHLSIETYDFCPYDEKHLVDTPF